MSRYNLKVFRMRKELTQAELADKIGYSVTGYAAIENGLRDGRGFFWSSLQEQFNIPNEEMGALMQNE